MYMQVVHIHTNTYMYMQVVHICTTGTQVQCTNLEPVNGTAVDKGGEHSDSSSEGVSDRAHG